MTVKALTSESIVLKDAAVADGEGYKWLTGINGNFQGGSLTLVIGPNGAGKTTLLEAIAGLRPLMEGSIAMGGRELWIGRGRKRTCRDLLLRMGIAMQQSQSQWFKATAQEEFHYSMGPYLLTPEEREQRIKEASVMAGFSLEWLSRDPWSLSGGQQKRLALACVLACRPEWLLLDEPSAGLDEVGKASLKDALRQHRDHGGGAIIVTHAPGAFLDLADSVMIVEEGGMRRVEPHEWPFSEKPEDLAARLAAKASGLKGEQAGSWHGSKTEGDRNNSIDSRSSKSLSEPSPILPDKACDKQNVKVWLRPDTFDPRILMFAYFLLTACLLRLSSLGDMAGAAVVTGALVFPFWPLFRQWLPVIRGVSMVTAALIAVAGITFGPLGFDWSATEATAIRLLQLLLLMVLGMPLLGLMTPLRLQRALDQMFGWLSRLGVPIASFTLLIGLIFRFIPLLSGEWQRFAKLARARGKTTARGLPLRQLKAMLIPFTRGILRLAEDMADALEARGYGLLRKKPVYGLRLKPGRSDAVLLAVAFAGCVLLYAMH